MFPGQFVQLLFIVGGHLDGGSQVLVQLLNGDLVVEAGSLNNLDRLEDIVGGLGGHGQLGDCGAKSLSRLLVLLLHEHDPLVRAETSLSTSLNCFSASSRASFALVSLSLVSSKPISSCWTFLP